MPVHSLVRQLLYGGSAPDIRTAVGLTVDEGEMIALAAERAGGRERRGLQARTGLRLIPSG
jgi:hypothetical protein